MTGLEITDQRVAPGTALRDDRSKGRVRRIFARGMGAARREDGAATIEFVMWLPVTMFLFALVADAALILGGEARVLRVVQDTNRAVSIGRITNVEDAQRQVFSQISALAPNAVVTTTVDSGLITTQVEIPATDFTSVGLVDAILTLDLMVTAQHLAES